MTTERLETRLDCSISIEMKRGGWQTYVAHSLTHSGMVVLYEEPIECRQLVQLRIKTDGARPPLEMMAKVVGQNATREGDPETRAATEIEFFALKGDTLQRWLTFLNGSA